MKKKDMLKILDSVNQNKDIKWNILENTGAKIYYTKDAGELMLSYVEHRIIVKEMVR